MFLPTKNTPRWIIFLIDVSICVFSFVLAYLVRFEFDPPEIELVLAKNFFLIFLAIRAISFVLGKTYSGIIRYTSTQDTQRIFITLTAGSILFFVLNRVKFHFIDEKYFIPDSIIIIEYLVTLFAMVVSRIAVKVMYMELKTPDLARKRAIIFGAGEAGIITKRTIDRDHRSGVEVIAFVDDDASKSGKKLEGTSIYPSAKLEEFLSGSKAEELILAVQNLDRKRRNELVNLALKYNVRVLNIPPMKTWIGGELSARQIRDVKIEDLLGRETIRLDSKLVRDQLKGKKVLISGAAGSIGSELVRQVLAYDPAQLVLLDQAETAMFELENELVNEGLKGRCELVIGNVTQYDRMKRMFDYFKPEIVYHAAAYKHVPLMENNPSEAVLTNVCGTMNMAELSREFGVEKFVMISTDKAVNPTNVMGATKRVAEMYIHSLNQVSETKFITTRFGNVLGSSGSVIPVFRKQIEEGGPVTVTHPDVTRYFMTIPEAVQLVLDAGAMGKGGEIFAFDMGELIKIYDLAKNMIQLSGLELGKDIEIKFTGLRPGEKLFEELIGSAEFLKPTHHPKILIADVKPEQFEKIKRNVEDLVSLFDIQDNFKIVKKLKEIVPEYISHNSEYEKLDLKE